MRHVISILAHNEPGVLSRICDLFSGRGYGIDSISAGTSTSEAFARVTVETTCDERAAEQIMKQLNRLIPILKVQEVTKDENLIREFVLCKVHINAQTRGEILKIADLFKAAVLDITGKTAVLQMSGNQSEISAFLEFVKPLGIRELARSGKVAMCPDTSVHTSVKG